MPSFPQEITDMVIDILRDDPDTLASLSLTGQSWSPRSCKYLHKTLKARHFGCIIYPAREVARVRTLLQLPSLMELAQELVLEEYDMRRTGEFWDKDLDDDDSNYADLLSTIIKRCTNVRLLTIDNISWDLYEKIPLHTKMWFFHAFPEIQSLTVNAGTFSCPEEFLMFLNTLPPLSRLTIDDNNTCMRSKAPWFSFQASPQLFNTKKTNLSGLRELVVREGRGYDDDAIRTLAIAFETLTPAIHTMDLDGCWMYTGTAGLELRPFEGCIARILGATRMSLKTLRLRFGMFEYGTNSPFTYESTDVGLGRCTTLETIELDFCKSSFYLEALATSTWTVILNLLEKGLPASIRQIKLVCIPDTQNLSLFKFGELEELLAKSSLSLETLVFEDALDPSNEPTTLSKWEHAMWRSYVRRDLKETPRILGYKEFRDTITTSLANPAASGVLRVTSQMRMYT